eukprot:GHVU01080887.1.p2 GENE.GHVU01080887.1~~GHVU01080887.1.p2  ORF type:complete len:102 (+),score=2.90 GHVU01080887.1:48-353(+)
MASVDPRGAPGGLKPTTDSNPSNRLVMPCTYLAGRQEQDLHRETRIKTDIQRQRQRPVRRQTYNHTVRCLLSEFSSNSCYENRQSALAYAVHVNDLRYHAT